MLSCRRVFSSTRMRNNEFFVRKLNHTHAYEFEGANVGSPGNQNKKYRTYNDFQDRCIVDLITFQRNKYMIVETFNIGSGSRKKGI